VAWDERNSEEGAVKVDVENIATNLASSHKLNDNNKGAMESPLL
jgi:hypothetical protein